MLSFTDDAVVDNLYPLVVRNVAFPFGHLTIVIDILAFYYIRIKPIILGLQVWITNTIEHLSRLRYLIFIES